MQSQTIGDVINLPPVEDLADDEIVFVSALVVAALESRGEFGYSGRVVPPGKNKRNDDGILEAILSWNTPRYG